MFTRTRVLAALLAVACLAPLAGSAVASSGMPKGKYYCRFYDGSTMGVIKVTGATKYAYHNGKTGSYRLSGAKLKFTSGPMKGVFKNGKLVRKSGMTYFLLYDGSSYGHAYTDATCIKQR